MEYLTLFLIGCAAGLVLVLLILTTIKLDKTSTIQIAKNKKQFIASVVVITLLSGSFVSGMTYIVQHLPK